MAKDSDSSSDEEGFTTAQKVAMGLAGAAGAAGAYYGYNKVNCHAPEGTDGQYKQGKQDEMVHTTVQPHSAAQVTSTTTTTTATAGKDEGLSTGQKIGAGLGAAAALGAAAYGYHKYQEHKDEEKLHATNAPKPNVAPSAPAGMSGTSGYYNSPNQQCTYRPCFSSHLTC